jgi:predicted Ser/Thr protein kinase
MPDGRPLKPGDPARLGSYTLTARLGEGGQGVVYLGESESGDQVAVKLLRADLANDDTARARFLRELDAVKRVARFCTAQVLDADVDRDRPYIVSEYVPGPSLAQLVSADSPRSGADLERLAIGTVTALVAIHQAGIVHRDFKPQNVLIGPDGPRVIDFGIARALDAAATMTNSAIGTPAYMAPEQLTAKDLTPAADIFSWASTMVYAATGQSPFGQDTVMAVIHRIMNEPPDLGSIEEPLRGIVSDCLAKEPAERPPTQALLMRLLGEEGLTPAGPGAGGDPQTAIMGQGAAFAGTAAAAGAAGAAIPPTAPISRASANSPTLPPVATHPGAVGARRTVSARAAVAALAGLLVAVGVIAVVVWAASRGGDHQSGGGGVQTPAPSSAPATSAQPEQPVVPTHRRQSTAPPQSNQPEPTRAPPTTHPTDSTSAPGGGSTQPGGGQTSAPGDGGASVNPGGGGGGGVTQPAANATGQGDECLTSECCSCTRTRTTSRSRPVPRWPSTRPRARTSAW